MPIDVKVVISAVDRATDKFRSIGKSLQNMGRQAEQLGSTLTRRLTVPIAAVGAGITKLAVDASKTQAVRAAFEQMTAGIVDSSDEFLSAVKKATVGTLSQYEILTSANRALSLIGKDVFKDFQTDFTTMAEMVRKSARATGYDINYLWDSLILGVGRGSKLILDNLGITTDITKAQEEYAKQLGKSRDELTATEQKTATLNHVMELLHEKYDSVQLSGTTAAEKMQELRATFKDMRDEVGAELAPALGDLIGELTPLMKSILPSLVKGTKLMVYWFNNLSPVVQKVIFGFMAGLAVLGPFLVLVGNLIATLSVLTKVVGLVAAGIGAISTPVWVAIAAIGALVAAGIVLYKNWDKLKVKAVEIADSIRQRFDSMRNNIVSSFESIRNTVRSKIEEIKNFLSRNWARWGIHIEVPDIGAMISRWRRGISGWVRQTIERLPDFLRPFAERYYFIRGHLPHFQTGGIVPGSPGEPQLAVVHGGEKITPSYVQRPLELAQAPVEIHIHAGTILASKTEIRNFGKMIWDELANLARAQNKTPTELINLKP